jgi:hypothetical protein
VSVRSALEENVQAIKRSERTILLARSKAEQVNDWIACTAGSGPVLVLHVVWFGAWVTCEHRRDLRDWPVRSVPIFIPDDDRFALRRSFWPCSSSAARSTRAPSPTSAVILDHRSICLPSEK